jgi:hypothetical protein
MIGYRDLTAAERAELHAELAPVLADLSVSGSLAPEVTERACSPAPGLSCFLYQPGRGSYWGITVRAGLPPAQRLANLAYQVQDWAVEAAWTAGEDMIWPGCEAHPQAHPLVPAVSTAGQAVWRCPQTESDVCAVGRLAAFNTAQREYGSWPPGHVPAQSGLV